MNDAILFRRIATISTLAAGLLILAASIVLPMAIDFNFEYLSNPAGLITAGLDADATELFRLGSILEMLGYFIFLIPAALYLSYWLKSQSPNLVNMATVFGLGSIFLGVIGAAIRASFFPEMMVAYPQAAESQRELLQIIFRSVSDVTFDSLYSIDSILAGLWWLGIGLTLRSKTRILGIVTTIMGIAVLGAGVGWLLRVDLLARLELFYFFVPFWAIWLGIAFLTGTEKVEQRLDAAAPA